ncbi:siroheme synthase [Castellaniella sp.]|uniref:siroheme synthase n=1 Tax=Castellaniella sp. TaxID=1955812 RepID=UPI002B001464|nr:NAD(P)-dependent oxidoreductase [Castellaniella sp.]
MSNYVFPLFIRLEGRGILVIGGGDIAERKIRLLMRSGARITAIAETFTPTLARLGDEGSIALLHGRFEPSLLAGAWLVIAATNDHQANRLVADACAARHLYVNVVDDAQLSTAHIPAIVDRSPLMIAISSAGCAPMFARAVRERIETMADPSLGPLTRMAQRHRPRMTHRFPDLAKRRALYEDLLRGPVLALLQQGRDADAEQAFLDTIARGERPLQGLVYIVGAPDDDPGDLTLNGLRTLNLADVLYYEERCHPGVLELARRDAARIPFHGQGASRAPDHATLRTMLEAVRLGQTLVILQPAAASLDCGNQTAFFSSHGIECFIIPGVPRNSTGNTASPSAPPASRRPGHSRFPTTTVTGEA